MSELTTYSERFVANLFNFISDVARYTGDQDCKTFLDIYTKLDMNKLLLRFVSIVGKNEDKLHNKDVRLFDSCIIPGIDLSTIWSNLTQAQQNKCWSHLQILFLNGNIVVKMSKAQQQQDQEQQQQEQTFDPYVGVGGDITTYSINDIMEGPKNLEMDELATPGLESMTKLFGIDKMINLDKLKEQLENMTDEDINEQTESIKKLLGANLDERSSALISSMLGDIKNALKDEDIKNANPIDLIKKVATNVSDKLKHNVSEADMEHLFKSTNMNNAAGFNPMSVLKKLNLNDKKSLESLMKNPAALQQLVEDTKKEEERLAQLDNKERLRQKLKNKAALRQSRR